MQKHKWYNEIVAWASGAEIEWALSDKPHEWITCNNQPSWGNDNLKFRIKPQPKEPQYLYVYKNKKGIDLTDRYHGYTIFVNEYIGKIKLENDDGA